MDKSKTQKDTNKPTLEDYIIEMETRPPDSHNQASNDVWTQLQQKENDLLLAAEIGKSLLEKNEELKKQQEKLIEEYSTKLEKLEQEKHVLKRQLEVAESECDSNVLELQADLKELKLKLEAQEQQLRQTEREKNALIEEITAQNTRLSTELQRSNLTEAQLSAQLADIREQFNRRNLSIQDHVNSHESLKNELKLILEKKHELEHRLQLSLAEKDTLSLALTEASDRIHTLERSAREQETKFKNTIKTLDRLERENSTLSERLESFDTRQGGDPQSLLHEMSCDDGISVGDASGGGGDSLLKKEAFAVYKQLKTLCQTLKITQNDDDSGTNINESTMLFQALQNFYQSLHSDMSFSSMENTNSSSQTPDTNTEIKFNRGMLSATADELVHIIMNLDAIQFKTMFDQTRSVLIDQEEELKKRQEKIMELESKLSVTEVELQGALDERNQAREDCAHSSLAQDEIVNQARQDRDTAVERRTKSEVELAKTRVELMQANGQLLEAIQQKVELLQQLEQWQIDMHELIEEQMKNKLNDSTRNQSPQRNVQSAGKRNRILDLFYR